MVKYEMTLEHLAEVEACIAPPIPVGPSSWGTRLIYPVVDGGTVNGPKLRGKILPLGADWGLVRADNCFELDVRIVIETDDGAHIHASYKGVAAMTQEEAGQFLTGETPDGFTFFTTPRFETAHKNYQWLTQIQAVGRGGVELDGDAIKVTYSWYILRQ